MKRRFVISNIPIKLPIQNTILYFFGLHYLETSLWVWIVLGIIGTGHWLSSITRKIREKKVDLNSTGTTTEQLANKLQNIFGEMED